MPELPEVETIVRGLAPHLPGKRIEKMIIRETRFRYPLSKDYADWMRGQSIHCVERRAKWLVLFSDYGYTLIHLGMSGRVQLLSGSVAVKKHDHIDWCFSDHSVLRFNDPRRFGSVSFSEEDIAQEKHFLSLGPEPLGNQFNAAYLQGMLKGRTIPIKAALMDNKVVVGVGNIYAQEALFQAAIHPLRPCNQLTGDDFERLFLCVSDVLNRAIAAGGSSIKDFVDENGHKGYFQHHFSVYGKEGVACAHCAQILIKTKINQRSTVFCPQCQL